MDVKTVCIADNVWKFTCDSNVYLLQLKEHIVVIDTGRSENKKALRLQLEKIVPLSSVDIVLFTHLHYDHISNADLFSHAIFYASKDSIASLQQDRSGAILHPSVVQQFSAVLHPFEELLLPELEVISTPGHTLGSVCFFYPEKKILFSGDTLFLNTTGRTDLPFSDASAMKKSLQRLKKLDYNILCPGHEY